MAGPASTRESVAPPELAASLDVPEPPAVAELVSAPRPVHDGGEVDWRRIVAATVVILATCVLLALKNL